MNWIARIFMGLLGLGLLAGLLLALGVYTVYASLRWLLTGRKPQMVLVWQQFSALRRSAGMHRGSTSAQQPFQTGQTRAGDVVDVEVRELRERTPRLPDDRVV